MPNMHMISAKVFSRVRLICPQCKTAYGKEDRVPAFEVENGMFDIYCPECEKFNARAEARVAQGEITRKDKEYVGRQKLTRISRLPDGATNSK